METEVNCATSPSVREMSLMKYFLSTMQIKSPDMEVNCMEEVKNMWRTIAANIANQR